MSKLIKEHKKPGILAWSNSKTYSELLVNANYNQENEVYPLEILSLDLQDRSKRLNVVGAGYSDTPFRCVAWDCFGEKDNTYPKGLIFTGMENGTFKLWNAQDLVSSYQPEQPTFDTQAGLIYDEEPEQGAFPVMCAEWNSLKNNYLALGSTEVLILDVKNLDSDLLMKPGKKNPHEGSYITSVSWNREVYHILASASENGLVALWDINSNSCIFQFKDSVSSSSTGRNVSICWSKSISTQIAVALDDEKRNQLQIWDLRNRKGPVIVIDKHHSKGINAMDWCQTDAQLILASSRDKKTVCWNYREEEQPLSQVSVSSIAHDVKWARKLPSIYSVSTEEGQSVYSLSDANLFSYIPKWYRISASTQFLGNNVVTTYSEQRGSTLIQHRLPETKEDSPLRRKLKSIKNLLETNFDEAIDNTELGTLLKAKQLGENQIYQYLGFSKAKIVGEVEKYTGKKSDFATGHQKEKHSKNKAKAFTVMKNEDLQDFFKNMNNFQQTDRHEQDDLAEAVPEKSITVNQNWDIGRERLIKQNILIGNYEGAIDAALKCRRNAEALIIAYSVDQDLFKKTLETFFTETTEKFITDVLKHIAHRDASELVQKYDLHKWRECVALIFSIASRERRPALLKQLSERLRTEVNNDVCSNADEIIPADYPVVLCLTLADDFKGVTQIYLNHLSLMAGGSSSRKQAAVEYCSRLISIYEKLTIEVQAPLFDKVVRQTAYIAIEEENSSLAHELFVKYLEKSSRRIVDYLVNSVPELQVHKKSVSFPPINLPIMQSKRPQKKAPKGHGQSGAQSQQHPKASKGSKAPQPPPVAHHPKQQQGSGFSPYEGQQRPAPGPKKVGSQPPPPPPPHSSKKPSATIHQPEEEHTPKKSERTIPPPARKEPPPPPGASSRAQPPPPPLAQKRPGPPPPPVSLSQPSEDEEDDLPTIKQTPKSRKQPPPPPPASGKKNTFSNNREEQEDAVQVQSQVKSHQPPPKKKAIPPPPKPQTQQQETPEPQRQEQYHNKPPSRIFESRPTPPPPKQQFQQEESQPMGGLGLGTGRKAPPPPAPGQRRGPPPPPPRR